MAGMRERIAFVVDGHVPGQIFDVQSREGDALVAAGYWSYCAVTSTVADMPLSFPALSNAVTA
jgi:hypothetical protein